LNGPACFAPAHQSIRKRHAKQLAQPDQGLASRVGGRLPVNRRRSAVRKKFRVACKLPPGSGKRSSTVGKYLIAWLLGVPAVVLVLIYLLFN